MHTHAPTRTHMRECTQTHTHTHTHRTRRTHTETQTHPSPWNVWKCSTQTQSGNHSIISPDTEDWQKIKVAEDNVNGYES